MWKFWRTEEPIYWLVFYYDIFTLKSEACDKSILKSFYNNDPLCGEPWFLRLRTRDKNFVYSHDSTYLLDDLIMNEKFADACLTIKYKRDKKQRNFTLQIMTHCIHSLCEFQPHWKFYFHFRDMSKIEVVKRSCEYNLSI